MLPLTIRSCFLDNNSSDNNDSNGNEGGRGKKPFLLIALKESVQYCCWQQDLVLKQDLPPQCTYYLLARHPKLKKLFFPITNHNTPIFEQIPLKIRPKCINKIIADNSISHIYQRSEHQRYLFGSHYEGLLPPCTMVPLLTRMLLQSKFSMYFRQLLQEHIIRNWSWLLRSEHVKRNIFFCDFQSLISDNMLLQQLPNLHGKF